MRILTVINWLKRGGLELQLFNSLPLLLERGIRSDICCTGPESDLDADVLKLGLQIFRIPKSFNCYRTAHHIEALLDRERFDLIHSHFGHTSGGIALGASRRNIPSMVSIHSSQALALYTWRLYPLLSSIRTQWLRWHYRMLQHHATMMIGHSYTNLNSFAPDWKSAAHRYAVVQNGVRGPQMALNKGDCRKLLGVGADSTVLLHIGSFKPEKNHVALIEIFVRFLKFEPNAILILVGEGKRVEAVRTLTHSKGISERVRFEGGQGNVWPYYGAADLFIFPSETEGFGNVLVESQLANLPVVASSIPAHHESVAPMQHRFLFPLPDYDAAAQLMKKQLEASRKNENPWVSEAQAYVSKHFSVGRMVNEYVILYEKLVASGQPRLAESVCH